MNYRVIHAFKDLKDNEYRYKVNDEYPNESAKAPTKKRIEELMSDKNKIGVPLIEEVEETTEEIVDEISEDTSNEVTDEVIEEAEETTEE